MVYIALRSIKSTVHILFKMKQKQVKHLSECIALVGENRIRNAKTRTVQWMIKYAAVKNVHQRFVRRWSKSRDNKTCPLWIKANKKIKTRCSRKIDRESIYSCMHIGTHAVYIIYTPLAQLLRSTPLSRKCIAGSFCECLMG